MDHYSRRKSSGGNIADIPDLYDKGKKTDNSKSGGDFFRFPFYINFPEDHYSPPLSSEESALRAAQKLFFICDFSKAKASFQELCENAESVYIRICACYFMCLLSMVYDSKISWNKYYCKLNTLISLNSDHKFDMDLFIPWLHSYMLQAGAVNKHLNIGQLSEYSVSSLPLVSFLSFFSYTDIPSSPSVKKYLVPYEIICHYLESSGCFYEAVELHFVMFLALSVLNDDEAKMVHLKKALQLSYENDLILTPVTYESYYKKDFDSALKEFPKEFAKLIRRKSEIFDKNFAEFSEKHSVSKLYGNLSSPEYQLLYYAISGLTNKQTAEMLKVSERTVADRYSLIYKKLGVDSKQAMINLVFAEISSDKIEP